MEIYAFLSVRFLAHYLAMVAILGNMSYILFFINATTTSVNTPLAIRTRSDHQHLNTTKANSESNISKESSINKTIPSNWCLFLYHSISIYEASFPIATTSSTIELNQDSDDHDHDLCIQRRPTRITISTILMTFLSAFFLLKGNWQMDYSSCQFWYYIQVGSLLLSCMKISILVLVGLWKAVPNTTIISILFGLIQLWLVQTFMENLRRRAETTLQKRCHTQIFAMNDFDLESCRFAVTKTDSV